MHQERRHTRSGIRTLRHLDSIFHTGVGQEKGLCHPATHSRNPEGHAAAEQTLQLRLGREVGS